MSGVAPPAAAAPAAVAITAADKSASGDKAELWGEATTKQDAIRLANSAKYEVYVCFGCAP